MPRHRTSWAATWFIVLAALTTLLAEFVAAGDHYRTFWMAVALVCWLAVRREFVKGLR